MKNLTLIERQENVIKNIKNLLSCSREVGDFGKTKYIDAECLQQAFAALEHLERLLNKGIENESTK